MVIGLTFLGLCILGSVALICFKGIDIKYKKTFIVKDERPQIQPIPEQPKRSDQIVNAETPEPAFGPMDSVIGEIQDLFGPDQDKDKD